MRQIVQLIALAVALGIGIGAGTQPTHAQQSQDPRVADLVQAGVLRVGLGLGVLTTAIKDPTTGELRGVGLEMGRALAARIGIRFVQVEYPRPGAVIAGVHVNAWDVSFLVIDPERLSQVEFSYPYLQSDFTYLAPPGSAIRRVADADQAGVRVVVPRGNATELFLSRTLKRAELVRAETPAAAVEMLRSGRADAQAGPRPALMTELPDLAGASVLDDGFATIYFAALVPKGQGGRLEYVNEFIEEAKASGLLKHVIESVGLQGVWPAPAGKLCPR